MTIILAQQPSLEVYTLWYKSQWTIPYIRRDVSNDYLHSDSETIRLAMTTMAYGADDAVNKPFLSLWYYKTFK